MATHVLLPVGVLLRRRDLASVIGSALLAKADGKGHRPIAVELEVPATTVRGWLRRFAARAELIAGHFARLAAWLDPSAAVPQPRGSPLACAVEAIGVAAVAAARRLGAHTGPFEFASGPAADGCCATPARPSRRRGSPAGSPANRRPLPRGRPTGKEPPCRQQMTAARPSRCFAIR
jgi:hypothetical protein